MNEKVHDGLNDCTQWKELVWIDRVFHPSILKNGWLLSILVIGESYFAVHFNGCLYPA